MNSVSRKTKADKKSRNKTTVPGFTTRRDIRRTPLKSKILNQETQADTNAATANESSGQQTHDHTIRDDENLSTEDFMERLRISYPTYREMLDDGLPVLTVGRYRRISGREFNRWAETQPLLRPDAARKTTKVKAKDSPVRA